MYNRQDGGHPVNTEQLFSAFVAVTSVPEVERILDDLFTTHAGECAWVPFGKRPNNRGIIEVGNYPLTTSK
jgi:hypothetical protein